MIQFSQIGLVLSKNVDRKLIQFFKEFKGHLFFLKIQKLRFFLKSCQNFFLLAFIDSFPTLCWLCFSTNQLGEGERILLNHFVFDHLK